jgi:membrane associated rhomboid family serine protease
MHLNVLHVIFNVLALTPLLERFESEFGTLVTLALFTGRKHIKRTVERTIY